MRSDMSQILQAFPNPLGEKISSSSGPSIVVKKTIMICEDDRDPAGLHVGTEIKVQIIGAISGKECLTKYSEIRKKGKTIDALLLDYSLGDTTGDEIRDKNQGHEWDQGYHDKCI